MREADLPEPDLDEPALREPTGSLDVALAHASRLLATDPALAAEQASEILRVVAHHPQAMLVLGAARNAGGDACGAVEVLMPLACEHRDWAAAPCDLGRALGRAGRGDDAGARPRLSNRRTIRGAPGKSASQDP
jgi:hypothetical protein